MKVGYCQFDLSRSHKVKVIKKTKLKILFPKGMYDNNVNISYDFHNRTAKNYVDLSLTCQGHPRSNIIAKNESQCMVSYICVIETESISVTVFAIITIKA